MSSYRSIFCFSFNNIQTLNIELWVSTFSCAFVNIHLDHRAEGSAFSSAFNNIHNLNIELWVLHAALHSKIFIFNRAMGSTFSSAFNNIHIALPAFVNIHLEYRALESIYSSAFKTKHTLNIELWVRHAALYSKNFISNIEVFSTISCIFNTALTLK